jgi:polyribonucleotide nucleotidyltransferase
MRAFYTSFHQICVNSSLMSQTADRLLSFETGKVGRQASGSVMTKMGDTVVYATVCAEREAESGLDFSPLRVDYFSRFRCGLQLFFPNVHLITPT